MTQSIPLIELKMGADVPEWLLVAEPAEPGAPRGRFRFMADVDVFDTPTCYLVLPRQLVPMLIDNDGMAKHRVYAASKPVQFAGVHDTYWPIEVNAWSIPTGAVTPPPICVKEIGDPILHKRPGLLARVWQAIFG